MIVPGCAKPPKSVYVLAELKTSDRTESVLAMLVQSVVAIGVRNLRPAIVSLAPSSHNSSRRRREERIRTTKQKTHKQGNTATMPTTRLQIIPYETPVLGCDA